MYKNQNFEILEGTNDKKQIKILYIKIKILKGAKNKI